MELLPEGWHAMMGEAIWMDAIFVFSRPKAHYRTNGELKPSAPSIAPGGLVTCRNLFVLGRML